MTLHVYHYPNCSTCKKALTWLSAKGIAFRPIDIVKTPPSAAVLARAKRVAKVDVRKLFNVSGVSYREGNFKERLTDMTEAEALAADGKLIKRPLAVGDGVALIGFDAAAWDEALGAWC